MVLIISVTILIIMALLAAWKLSVWLAGSQEVKNSVDAACLKAASRCVEVKVNPKASYTDVADSTGMIGISNINRMWGKAYLINMNAQSMNNSGYGGGSNGDLAFSDAQSINSELYSLLTNRGSTYAFFTQFAAGKNAKMLGQQGNVKVEDTTNWATACVYRGEESNILFTDPAVVPQNLPQPNSIKINNAVFLQGYNPFEANSHPFCFTVYHSAEAPHLISNSIFEKSRKATVSGAENPIPNAFRASGQVDGDLTEVETACAVSNPMREFKLTIPHSYVIITVMQNYTCCLNNGFGLPMYFNQQGKAIGPTPTLIPYYADTGTVNCIDQYTYKSAYPISLGPPPKLAATQGIMNGQAALGKELSPETVWQAINALPGNHLPAINAVLQRVKEFAPGTSQANLQQALMAAPLGHNSTFYIYPTYTQPDNSDPKLTCSTTPPPWINGQQAEGNGQTIVLEETVVDNPNHCWDSLLEAKYTTESGQKTPYFADVHRCKESGAIAWKPGTGYNQCLGVLAVARHTSILFTSWPTQAQGFLNTIFPVSPPSNGSTGGGGSGGSGGF